MLRAPVFIASSNHGRDLSRALSFVDAAAQAGCDAVKFQLFRIDRMFAPEILIARVRESVLADGSGFKEPQPSELSDREWRADPMDGMRPLCHVRAAWEPAA